MSGIAGTMSPDGHKIVSKMLQKIQHRGSSQEKIWNGTHLTLGALGISEVFEEPGPIENGQENTNIVMDGRLTQRNQLFLPQKSGISSNISDVALLHHAYKNLGEEIFENLDGEFALAVADGNRFILARDILGIRPLYYGFRQGKLFFASEIKALMDIAEEIHEFPPGHVLLSDLGMFPSQALMPEDIQLDNPKESARLLSECLMDAVQRAVPEGIDVGVWLSGGVDSSAVAVLAGSMKDQIYTFSAGLKGALDLKYARMVARHIGSKHYERIYTLEEMLGVMDKVIYQLETFDAPLVRSAIGNYLVAELSSNYVPFVLSGEGGDELFAGYSYQKECEGEVELTLSIQDAISSLHNTALQRVDRSASAHGIGVTTPFLDPEVVRYALAIPAKWKIREPESIEKWPLRKALQGLLPEEIVWREKEKFWEGAGVWETLAEYAEKNISHQEFEKERNLGSNFQIRSKEELLYYRVFKQYFGDKVPLEEIGRTQHI